MTDTKPRGEWWCAKCRLTLDGSNVTFEERCDTCGHGVEWVESLPTIQADLAALRERLAAAERERDEARGAIPHPGDGSCENCGKVPSAIIPTALCDECIDGVKRAETAEALVRELAKVVKAAQAYRSAETADMGFEMWKHEAHGQRVKRTGAAFDAALVGLSPAARKEIER